MRVEILAHLCKPGEEALAMAIERGILYMHRECRWPEPEYSDFGRGGSHWRGSQSDAARPGVLLAIDYPDFQRRGTPLSVAIIGAAKQRKLVGAAREVFGVRPRRGVSISEAIVQRILVSVKRGHAGSGEAGKWFFRDSTAEILRAAPEAILDMNRATAGGGRSKISEWKLLDEPNERSSILGRRLVRS